MAAEKSSSLVIYFSYSFSPNATQELNTLVYLTSVCALFFSVHPLVILIDTDAEVK